MNMTCVSTRVGRPSSFRKPALCPSTARIRALASDTAATVARGTRRAREARPKTTSGPLIRGESSPYPTEHGSSINTAAFSETYLVLGLHLEKHFLRHRALNEAGAVVGEAGADAVGLFDHGCARTVTSRRPCHLVATHMASAVAVRYPRSRSGASRESASYPARRCLTA